MRWVVCLALLATSVVAGPKLEGSWQLTMEREARWTPRVCRAELSLERVEGKWSGTIRWDVLMGGRRIPLRDIEVRGSKFSFAWDVERFAVKMSGKLGRSGLKGICDWQGVGEWAFTAERAEDEKAPPKGVVRIEEGAEFRDYFQPATPEQARVDPKALDRLVVAAEKADTDALLVLKDRNVVCERYFDGWSGRIHLMSVTKFVTALAMAKLIEDGKLSLDDPVRKWLPPFSSEEVTLRHLMAHTSGLVHPRMAHTLNKKSDKVAYVCGLPVEKPGTKCAYSNEGVALLSGVIAKAAGEPVDAYLKRTLFEPLAIRDWAWDRDGAGNTITYAQLYMTARDLARLGRLCLDHGGELLSGKVLREFAAPGSKLDRGRGLIFRLWHDPDGFGHTGWLGQFLVVYPDKGLVGVRLRRARDPATFENRKLEFGAFAGMLADLVR